jgi:iron complex transport system ATP-binding protein
MRLVCDSISFSYPSTPVLDALSFELEEGKLLAVLGRNGAGKSTLLKCLNRVLVPQHGSVVIDGIDMSTARARLIARNIASVPQGALAPRMKVYDLALLGRRPYFKWEPSKRDHQMVEKALSLMGIEHLALRYADEVSGGEFQLVQIVRALAQDPQVLLFDEPTSSLDMSNQHRLMERIGAIIHGGEKAAVMTMHDVNLALRYADDFLLLKDGVVCAAGDRAVVTEGVIEEVYGLAVKIVDAGGYRLVVPR